jgi:hypothetical protein
MTSKYTTEERHINKKQYSTGTKTDMKTNGTEASEINS